MPPQRDLEMAQMYGVPVDLLRSRIGMPKCLWGARDDEVVGGFYVRVATAAGLESIRKAPAPPSAAALPSAAVPPSTASTSFLTASTSTSAPPSAASSSLFTVSTSTAAPTPPAPPPLRCYLVSYLPPEDSAQIRFLMEDREPGRRAFKIINTPLLLDKETSHMEIQAEIIQLNKLRNSLLGPKDLLEKHKNHQDSTGTIGLRVGSKIHPLKIKYLLALIAEGKTEAARSFLKDINPKLYRTAFPELPGSPRGTPKEERDLLVDVTSELVQLYPLTAGDTSTMLGKQMVGVIGRLLRQEKSC